MVRERSRVQSPPAAPSFCDFVHALGLISRLTLARAKVSGVALWVAEACLAWHRPEIFRRARDWHCLSTCRCRLPRHRRGLPAFIALSLMRLLSASKSGVASEYCQMTITQSEKLCEALELRAKLTSETTTFSCGRATRYTTASFSCDRISSLIFY